MILRYNGPLQMQINAIARVAEYLWTKGWAERNAGNITVNITEQIGADNKQLPALTTIPLYHTVPELEGQYYYATSAGSRMRDVARDPMDQGIIMRVMTEGKSIEIIADKKLTPTTELPSHLAMHQFFAQESLKAGISVSEGRRVVFHTHPTELIALSHIKALQNTQVLTKTLYQMQPEVQLCVPGGLAWVPYEEPGSMELALASIRDMKDHRFMLWEHHGVLGTGHNITEVFDMIDTLNKAAQIYIFKHILEHL